MYNKLIIASVPRTGSTLLFRAIKGLPPSGGTPPEYYVSDKPFHQSIAQTHSTSDRILYGKMKVVFTFRDPIESIISTRLHRWDLNHFKNCGVVDRRLEDCNNYIEDFLGYEKIFDSWTKDNGYPVMAVNYESMFNNKSKIEEFIEREFNFPQWKPRDGNTKNNRDKISKEDLELIEKTYSRFIEKVNKMESITYYE